MKDLKYLDEIINIQRKERRNKKPIKMKTNWKEKKIQGST